MNKPKTYEVLPDTLEAIQYNGKNLRAIKKFVGSMGKFYETNPVSVHFKYDFSQPLKIGDWVVHEYPRYVIYSDKYFKSKHKEVIQNDKQRKN